MGVFSNFSKHLIVNHGKSRVPDKSVNDVIVSVDLTFKSFLMMFSVQ